jgi:hypothetical protein
MVLFRGNYAKIKACNLTDFGNQKYKTNCLVTRKYEKLFKLCFLEDVYQTLLCFLSVNVKCMM